MSEAFTVGVAGATGALGAEILDVLERAPWAPETVVPLARAASTVPFVEWRGEQLAVDDLAVADLGELDLLFCAVPPEAAREYGGRAADDGVKVVDCSGAFLADGDVPPVVPWVNPGELSDGDCDMVGVPCAESTLMASVLGPLFRAGLAGEVSATVMRPASCWGRRGIEELSKQVIALFNSGTAPRRVFPSGLAFDLIPTVGTLDDAGETALEKRARVELGQILGNEHPLHLTLVGVPVFSGVCAEIEVRTSRQVPATLVEQILADGGVKQLDGEGERAIPRPRRVEGQPFACFGRVRVSASGVIRIWAGMDNLKASAAVAVASAGAILRRG